MDRVYGRAEALRDILQERRAETENPSKHVR
jgi:hypothetical protein